jgi:hypothetical protein
MPFIGRAEINAAEAAKQGYSGIFSLGIQEYFLPSPSLFWPRLGKARLIAYPTGFFSIRLAAPTVCRTLEQFDAPLKTVA